MNLYKRIGYLLILALSTSCEDVIDVNLNTAEPRLVIDANISWAKGTDGSQQTIRLSTTADYYAAEVPPVSGAEVLIANSSGEEFHFVETSEAGRYDCGNFVPVIGEEYRLTIINNGHTYTASEKLIEMPEISAVEQDGVSFFGNEWIRIKVYYPDNGEEGNFYLSEVNTAFLATPTRTLIDNELSQGNRIQVDFMHEDLEVGNEVTFRIGGISRRFFHYMTLLEEVTSGGAFSTPPANIRGNIVNQTDGSEYALGYFRLSEVEVISYVVK
ncbi:DUF4249 domain-containing protein [Algoriphagus sp. AGSA1]|uniref:DUF4249 domain-containing protein n=1 Tax=Algoriphagus sp. AGSA1 TaxID=2907213 RepID=UPI001F346AE1|nr:DUF4249 domain-containing protein [Algoriphagus sp. AGSA1]MCE7056427.1 DUF4249 domain-containing protein [Algoriphagus sp. AGSA1]